MPSTVEGARRGDVIFENGHTTTTLQIEASLVIVVDRPLPFAGSAGIASRSPVNTCKHMLAEKTARAQFQNAINGEIFFKIEA